jgi:predicted nucleic acid-binding protein
MVLDSSTLISLAWAGQLELLSHLPIPLVIPDEVRHETVTEGLARGHPDAAAIERAIKTIPGPTAEPSRPDGPHPIDHAVLEAGRLHGALATNDLALGRRAANLGVQWLRTADLVVLCVRAGAVSEVSGVAALRALRSAGRITEDLLIAYLEDLP